MYSRYVTGTFLWRLLCGPDPPLVKVNEPSSRALRNASRDPCFPTADKTSLMTWFRAFFPPDASFSLTLAYALEYTILGTELEVFVFPCICAFSSDRNELWGFVDCTAAKIIYESIYIYM